MNQHLNHNQNHNGSLNHHGPATLDQEVDREQIVSLKSKLHESGLPDHALQGGSLVERLDPALGEATSGMGALLTELIRRTLRGGVQRIDDELQSQVEEKVDATVAERMPLIESAAGQAAEVKARQVVGEECQATRQEVRQTASRLDGQLAQTRLELTATKDKLAETKTQLTAAQHRLTETQQDLGQQIVSSSHRVERTARDLVREQVESLTKRSKGTLQSLNGRIEGLGGRSDALELRLEYLENQLTRMAARVIEVERPRGLRRFWLALTGKRRKVVKQ
jgi:hypothetical protein